MTVDLLSIPLIFKAHHAGGSYLVIILFNYFLRITRSINYYIFIILIFKYNLLLICIFLNNFKFYYFYYITFKYTIFFLQVTYCTTIFFF